MADFEEGALLFRMHPDGSITPYAKQKAGWVKGKTSMIQPRSVMDDLEQLHFYLKSKVPHDQCVKDLKEIMDRVATMHPVWRSVETAPKDGTWMLGYYPDDRWAANIWVVRCESRRDAVTGKVREDWYGDHHSCEYGTDKPAPTYWMPLPLAPDQNKEPK